MKTLACILFVLGLPQLLAAQVPKKVVVEHFTNSHCSVCAAQNPGFYNNLANHPSVLSLGVHPSSPYPACIFSQHLQPGNDDRTNYYGVYGATPRFVVQGEIKSNAGAASASFFTPYFNQQSPVSIKIIQKKYGADSIRVRVVLRSVINHTLSALSLFTALAEDTVFYTSPNGETKHYNVLRKNLTSASGSGVNLGMNAGDSLVVEAVSAMHTAWNASRMFALCILQAADKRVVQAEASKAAEGHVMALPKMTGNEFQIFVSGENYNEISVRLNDNPEQTVLKIFDLAGKMLFEKKLLLASERICLESFPKGIYVYQLNYKGQQHSGKLSLR